MIKKRFLMFRKSVQYICLCPLSPVLSLGSTGKSLLFTCLSVIYVHGWIPLWVFSSPDWTVPFLLVLVHGREHQCLNHLCGPFLDSLALRRGERINSLSLLSVLCLLQPGYHWASLKQGHIADLCSTLFHQDSQVIFSKTTFQMDDPAYTGAWAYFSPQTEFVSINWSHWLDVLKSTPLTL